MIVLTKGETKDLIFTATENCLLTNPYFLLVFKNRVTQEEVKFVVENISLTERYDLCSLIVNDYFESAETGFWTYDIYEQEDDVNLNTSGLNKVETGYMYLNSEIQFDPKVYDYQSNNFITYNG